jgi:hypothetical protein
MGYAGYVPAKLPPGKLTPLQQALFSIGSPECLQVLEKVVYNTAVMPTEVRLRDILSVRSAAGDPPWHSIQQQALSAPATRP